VSNVGVARGSAESGAVVAAARAGDEAAFAGLAEGYRRELQVHCYRMLGSYDDSEDLVQETYLRAWRRRESYEGRSTFRAWLYRIATNACLDFLERHPRRPAPRPLASALGVSVPVPRLSAEVSWLRPFPDRLLDATPSGEAEPDAAVVAKETIELAFLVAIQHLPPRQRAVLILRDVAGWPAKETAELLDLSVAAVKSALQRARVTLKEHLPPRREEWAPQVDPTQAERDLLERYVDTFQRADYDGMAALLSEDVRLTMPPHPMWIAGRAALLEFTAQVLDPASGHFLGTWRSVPTRANRQPAVAHYVQHPDYPPTRDLPPGAEYGAQVLDVLRVEDGKVVEITSFEPAVFPSFGLPLFL
jgi:RNA polymerase sigma-70 factor (ECF subfamily)